LSPIPFLYLPDAVSLLLLCAGLMLLRELAVEHLRIEMEQVRAALRGASGTADLSILVDAIDRLAPRISPARLFFIQRAARPAARLDPIADFERRAEAPAERSQREKLLHLRFETLMRTGLFVLLGSVSGWILSLQLLARIVWRLRGYPRRDRADRFVDLWEKLVPSVGRRALGLALLADS
jgi:hypothetical protein